MELLPVVLRHLSEQRLHVVRLEGPLVRGEVGEAVGRLQHPLVDAHQPVTEIVASSVSAPQQWSLPVTSTGYPTPQLACLGTRSVIEY